jgi:hypothetical protein
MFLGGEHNKKSYSVLSAGRHEVHMFLGGDHNQQVLNFSICDEFNEDQYLLSTLE